MTDSLQRPIVISVGLHVAVAAALLFRAVLIPSEPIELRDAIRVDVVGLPEKMNTLPPPLEEKAAEPAPVPAKPLPPKVVEAKPTPTPKVDLKAKPKPDSKQAQNKALNKLREMEALEKINQEIQKSAKGSGKSKAQVVRGAQVTAGNSLTGLERLDYDRYFNSVKVKVNSNMSVPQWLVDADLHAQVSVQIDEHGAIIHRQIKTSSKNDVFDSKALEAVDASAPFPPPPERLRGLLSTSGIVFNFP